MNRFAFMFLAWVTMGLELGMREPLRLKMGSLFLAPSFALIVMVVISLGTPPGQAAWACFLLGLLVDMTWSPVREAGWDVVVGPHAIGFVLGGQAVLAVRSQVVRRNPVTLAFLTLVAGAVAHVMVCAMLTVRSFYDPMEWDVVGELLARFGTVAYSAIAAWFLGYALFRVPPVERGLELTGLDFSQSRGWGRRL